MTCEGSWIPVRQWKITDEKYVHNCVNIWLQMGGLLEPGGSSWNMVVITQVRDNNGLGQVSESLVGQKLIHLKTRFTQCCLFHSFFFFHSSQIIVNKHISLLISENKKYFK